MNSPDYTATLDAPQRRPLRVVAAFDNRPLRWPWEMQEVPLKPPLVEHFLIGRVEDGDPALLIEDSEGAVIVAHEIQIPWEGAKYR